MSLQLRFAPYTLHFNFAAGTSRGVFHHKKVWFIKLYEENDNSLFGLGEVAPIDRLSVDYNVSFEEKLDKLSVAIRRSALPKNTEEVYKLVASLVPQELPSIRFALETAFLDLIHGGVREIFQNIFFKKQQKIPINGLVWMGDEAFMKEQIDTKLAAGFSCLKMKIGAIDFEKERDLQNELAKDEPDVARASQLQKEISDLQSQFDQKRIEHMVEMRKLNPNAGQGYRSGGPMMGSGGSMMGSRGSMMGSGFNGGGYCW